MKTSIYQATCWAQGKSRDEIKAEIDRCEKRYFQPYPWNGTENAQNTITRIETLKHLFFDFLT